MERERKGIKDNGQKGNGRGKRREISWMDEEKWRKMKRGKKDWYEEINKKEFEIYGEENEKVGKKEMKKEENLSVWLFSQHSLVEETTGGITCSSFSNSAEHPS